MVMCNSWLGVIGSVLAILGVVAAPITSGDTALRSARLIIADFLSLDQHSVRKRLYISIPLFLVTLMLLVWQIENKDGFNIIWKYFGWANQTLSVFTLWTLTVYLATRKKCYYVSMIPAIFMTIVCVSFFCISKQSLNMLPVAGYFIAIICSLIMVFIFYRWKRTLK